MLKRHWFLICLGLLAPAGLAFPECGKAIGDSRAPPILVATTLFVSGLTLDTRRLARQLTNARAIALGLLSTYAAAPALAFLLAHILGPAGGEAGGIDPFFLQSVMIAASQATTLASAIALTTVARGDQELALVLTVASNAATMVLTPLVLRLTLGGETSFQIGAMMQRMALIIILPVGLGQVARAFLWSALAHRPHLLRLVPQMIILSFVYTGASTAAAELKQEPTLALRFLAIAAGLHALLLLWTYGAATLLRLPDAARTAIVFCGSQKTLPNGIYLWRTFFPQNPSGAVALVLYHILQLVTDTLLAPWFGREGRGACRGRGEGEGARPVASKY
jgi:sodium/bile acid cotransporter 7